MDIHRVPAILFLAALPLSCARGNAGSRDTERDEASAPVAQSAVALTGNWDLASDPPLPPPGLHIRFTVDSVQNSTFFGRLTHYFSGNVGGDITAFQPFAGSMADRHVEFRVDHRDPAMLGIVVSGTLDADTIRANMLVIGPDTLSSSSDRVWFLVKR